MIDKELELVIARKLHTVFNINEDYIGTEFLYAYEDDYMKYKIHNVEVCSFISPELKRVIYKLNRIFNICYRLHLEFDGKQFSCLYYFDSSNTFMLNNPKEVSGLNSIFVGDDLFRLSRLLNKESLNQAVTYNLFELVENKINTESFKFVYNKNMIVEPYNDFINTLDKTNSSFIFTGDLLEKYLEIYNNDNEDYANYLVKIVSSINTLVTDKRLGFWIEFGNNEYKLITENFKVKGKNVNVFKEPKCETPAQLIKSCTRVYNSVYHTGTVNFVKFEEPKYATKYNFTPIS